MNHHLRAALTLAAVPLVLSACGGGSETATTTSPPASPVVTGEEVQVTATEFAFGPAAIEVESGDFTIELVNQGAIEHNFNIEGVDTFVATKAAESAKASFSLAPGTYKVFCSIAGHEAAGMTGTLTVG